MVTNLGAHARADGQHVFEGAFGDQQTARRVFDHHAQPLASEVVGNFVRLAVTVLKPWLTRRGNGFVERIGQTGLEVRIEPGQAHYFLGDRAVGVQRAIQFHDAFGERAGLIGT